MNPARAKVSGVRGDPSEIGSDLRGRMRKREKTEIVVERDQILVIRRLDNRAPYWCEECTDQTQMVSVDEAAAIVRLTERAIYKQVELGQIHFTETSDGFLLVCLKSLTK